MIHRSRSGGDDSGHHVAGRVTADSGCGFVGSWCAYWGKCWLAWHMDSVSGVAGAGLVATTVSLLADDPQLGRS